MMTEKQMILTEKIQREMNDLEDKMVKLSYFIDASEEFKSLPAKHKLLLRYQTIIMSEYYDILDERLDLI